MATTLRSDPALIAAIERARVLAQESGELRARRWPAASSPLPPEAAAIVASWVRDGGFSGAVAELAATDADLADQ